MKRFVLFSVFTVTIALTTLGQFQVKNALNYSPPLQIDSSQLYIIGSLIDRSNKSKFDFGPNYRFNNIWTNVLVYNSSLNQIKKLFTNNLISIMPVVSSSTRFSYGQSDYKFSSILKNHLVFLIQNDSFNNDGIIDENDPIYLFVSSKSGMDLKQISPNEMNLVSWSISKDNNTILAKFQKDKNGDKKFIDEDEIIYQVDLKENISKIKVYPINLQ